MSTKIVEIKAVFSGKLQIATVVFPRREMTKIGDVLTDLSDGAQWLIVGIKGPMASNNIAQAENLERHLFEVDCIVQPINSNQTIHVGSFEYTKKE